MPWIRSLSDKLLTLTRGRTTAFFLMFFFGGHAMAFFGKLNADYVAFVGVLGGLILGHSGQENYFATKKVATPDPVVTPPPEGGD